MLWAMKTAGVAFCSGKHVKSFKVRVDMFLWSPSCFSKPLYLNLISFKKRIVLDLRSTMNNLEPRWTVPLIQTSLVLCEEPGKDRNTNSITSKKTFYRFFESGGNPWGLETLPSVCVSGLALTQRGGGWRGEGVWLQLYNAGCDPQCPSSAR